MVALVGSFTPFQPRAVSLTAAIDYIQDSLRYGTYLSRVDWVSNFLLFLPLAFFATGVVDRAAFSIAARALRVALLILALSAFSIVLEVCQIWLAGRVPSPHDVAAQLLGTLCGMCIWFACGVRASSWLWARCRTLHSGGAWATLSKLYVAGLLGYSLFPLDLTLHPGELIRKWRTGQVTLLPFTDPVSEDVLSRACLRHLLLYLPIGVFAASAKTRPAGRGRSLSLAGWVLFPFGVEFLEIFVLSRWTSTTQALAGLAGMAIGAAGTRIFRRAQWTTFARPNA
jgi:VanZ family protein